MNATLALLGADDEVDAIVGTSWSEDRDIESLELLRLLLWNNFGKNDEVVEDPIFRRKYDPNP
jgi:hypothetical protein